ncbi:MAG: primosomal protein N' [Sulfurovum sp.]|nr:primosomal protein N' [Sulfurovum sp.]
MYYYKVSLHKSSAPILTYSSLVAIELGRVVLVGLKSTEKQAVIYVQTTNPTFATTAILSLLDYYYTPLQIQMATFISAYYFSSFSEAIGLFLPYATIAVSVTPLMLPIVTKPILSPAQQKAYEGLLPYKRAVLFGVTGSGKTEIFISLIIKMQEEGKSAIFLMPEISLTPQMEKRLSVYFGTRVAMWHSKLTKKRKTAILEGMARREITIIAGARSALFVPLPHLGLIIVDEEHDDSYKASSRPRYHARDVALFMGQKYDAQVILASATPSIGSYYKHPVIRLKEAYRQKAKTYTFITGTAINRTILESLSSHYKAGHQSLLFLPTRGNFKYLYCEKCGKTHFCPYCSVGMALHRKFRHLKCHYCNYTEAIREECSYCNHSPLQSNRMGTSEAIEIIGEAIEGLSIEQFDKDSISSSKKLKDALKRFESKESQLLLGTQMLSKGHDYANITLCVIMGLDYILGLSDYRARERALALLFQIAGRSGRALEAEVLVQTADADFFKRYLSDYEYFIKDELAFLEMAEYPPFVFLARILIAHKDESKAGKITLDTVSQLKAFVEVEIVGSGKAPVERVANKFRFHILLRAKTRKSLLTALHQVNRRELEIDIDPVEFS